MRVSFFGAVSACESVLVGALSARVRAFECACEWGSGVRSSC